MTPTEMLMATRGSGVEAEAEPVLAAIVDGLLVLDLDDGDRLALPLSDVLSLALSDDEPAGRAEAA